MREAALGSVILTMIANAWLCSPILAQPGAQDGTVSVSVPDYRPLAGTFRLDLDHDRSMPPGLAYEIRKALAEAGLSEARNDQTAAVEARTIFYESPPQQDGDSLVIVRGFLSIQMISIYSGKCVTTQALDEVSGIGETPALAEDQMIATMNRQLDAAVPKIAVQLRDAGVFLQ